jgi:hypothetical protein
MEFIALLLSALGGTTGTLHFFYRCHKARYNERLPLLKWGLTANSWATLHCAQARSASGQTRTWRVATGCDSFTPNERT